MKFRDFLVYFWTENHRKIYLTIAFSIITYYSILFIARGLYWEQLFALLSWILCVIVYILFQLVFYIRAKNFDKLTECMRATIEAMREVNRQPFEN